MENYEEFDTTLIESESDDVNTLTQWSDYNIDNAISYIDEFTDEDMEEKISRMFT